MKYSKELCARQKVSLLICGLLQTAFKQNWLRHSETKFIFPKCGLLQRKTGSALHILWKNFISVLGLKDSPSSSDPLFFSFI